MVITLTVSGFTSSEPVWLQTNVNKFWMDRLCGSPVLDCYWQRLLTPNQELATYQYSEQSHMFALLGMTCLTTMWMICNPSGRGCWRGANISQWYIKRGTAQWGASLETATPRWRLVGCWWLHFLFQNLPEQLHLHQVHSVSAPQWVCFMLILPQHKVRYVVVLGKPPVAVWHHHTIFKVMYIVGGTCTYNVHDTIFTM